MNYLNLGCGQQFHQSWVNIDFVSTGEGVLAHNILRGIPYPDNLFDVVYHSHLLEHFSKSDGVDLIVECYRVLKPNGIIRIAIPDLEEISKNYLKNLEGALEGDPEAALNYEWIMLEMFDQTVRNQGGGEMAKYFYRKDIPNKAYVFDRLGAEAKNLHNAYLQAELEKSSSLKPTLINKFKLFIYKCCNILVKSIFYSFIHKFLNNFNTNRAALRIGKFRLSGEVHQWMYDRHSLSVLLKNANFKEIKVVSAFESNIPNWESYQLDSKEGIVRKPDSLFIEAIK
jgi:predicted SAM-dependent methyltransferase